MNSYHMTEADKERLAAKKRIKLLVGRRLNRLIDEFNAVAGYSEKTGLAHGKIKMLDYNAVMRQANKNNFFELYVLVPREYSDLLLCIKELREDRAKKVKK